MFKRVGLLSRLILILFVTMFSVHVNAACEIAIPTKKGYKKVIIQNDDLCKVLLP